MYLEMECTKCAISKFCPKRGSSPARLPNNTIAKCRLIGGYSKRPVDPNILSEKSRILYDNNGKCMTIAEIPVVVGGLVLREVVKIFSPPYTQDRETTQLNQEIMLAKSVNHK